MYRNVYDNVYECCIQIIENIKISQIHLECITNRLHKYILARGIQPATTDFFLLFVCLYSYLMLLLYSFYDFILLESVQYKYIFVVYHTFK